MAQTDQAPQEPRRRSHGCLWGCLGLAVLLALAAGGGIFYGGWSLYEGFKHNPRLQEAMAVVRSNPTAHEVLGDNIEVESLESETFTSNTNSGRSATYTATLKGTKGEAQLHVTFHTDGKGKMHIVAIVLTGPDGERYNLTAKTTTTPPGTI